MEIQIFLYLFWVNICLFKGDKKAYMWVNEITFI